ncbi:MAG: CPBP family intramembrane metalloprotease [Clostridia bacterium]|nr:CPBP family intramembrane metalloprotease [Clostridia bacterium]
MRIKLKPSITAPLLVFIIYLLMGASTLADVEKLGQRDNVFLAVIILQIILFIIPGILYCRLKGSGFISKVHFNAFSLDKLWMAVCSFFVLASGSALIKVGLYAIGYYSQQYTLYESYLPNDASSISNLLYILIAIAIIPAVTEEFIFRGIVLGEYRDCKTTPTTAVMLSAALFAMLHFNMYQFPVYFFGGIVLGYVTVITNSVFCAMIVHLLNNIFSLLFEPQLLRLISQTDSPVFVLFILAIIFFVFLILTLQCIEKIYYNKGIRGEMSSPKKRKKRKKDNKLGPDAQAALSPVFILCVISYIILTLTLK